MAEYFTRSAQASVKDINSILALAISIPHIKEVHLARALTFIALHLSTQELYIKAEGLFRGALDRLSDDQYEKAECLCFYGQMLKKLDRRYDEGADMIKKSKELAHNLAQWAPLSVNLFLSEPY